MINIAQKSKGSMDQASILSMNKTRIQGAFTAGNITGLNLPPTVRRPLPNTQAGSPPRTHTQAGSPPRAHVQAGSPPRAHAQAGLPPRTHAQAGSQNSAHTQTASSARAAVPSARKLPAFVKPLQKGQKAPLSANGTNLGILNACFGWNTLNAQCDVDVSAFLLGADGKIIGDSWFVFYGQASSPDKSCQFKTSQSLDREIITIDFQKLNTDVKKIVFVLTINEAFAKKLHFGMIKDAYIRILDAHGNECVSFQMTEYYSNVISMMIGEVYLYNGSWKFNAVGNGVAKDLAGLCALYGVEVSD